jgi:signal transduction histidine kinase
MVRMIRAQDGAARREVDIGRVLEQTAERWSTVAERRWVVHSSAGVHRCAPERLRALLDTLVENSVRYTRDGDVVRLLAFDLPGGLAIGVADAGPGLPPGLARALNGGPEVPGPPVDGPGVIDPLAQTGLGLELVREVAGGAGGRVAAGRSAEGGALVLAVVPAGEPVAAPVVRPDVPARVVRLAGAGAG